jgi:sugar O-acyltransferase (sialic acid O-acetyltransferase NeuD family)
MIKLIFIGSGGHANSCLDVVNSTKKFNVIGSISEKNNSEFLKDLGSDKDLRKIRKKYKFAHIAVGFIQDYKIRKKIYENIKKLKFILPTIISSSSIVSKFSSIDEGTIVMHQAILNFGAKVGKNTIINSKVLIEHDSIIGSNCHISTAAVINGNSEIGDNTFIGSGTIVNNGIKIGKNCVIGSGLLIKKNIKDNEIRKK